MHKTMKSQMASMTTSLLFQKAKRLRSKALTTTINRRSGSLKISRISNSKKCVVKTLDFSRVSFLGAISMLEEAGIVSLIELKSSI